MANLLPSRHFQKRTAQRQLSPDDVAFVMRYGQIHYRTGVQFYFLGHRNIPDALRGEPQIDRLEGFTVLAGHDGTLITAYKHPQALRQIKRKAKRRLVA